MITKKKKNTFTITTDIFDDHLRKIHLFSVCPKRKERMAKILKNNNVVIIVSL